MYPDHAADAEGLLRAADVALFRAKELGRNRFTLYSPALFDAAAQRFRLEQSLRRAVEKGELLLMYQPQVSLHSFEASALEALLRWRKSDGRVATASEFIHVAEKTGLIHELTGWILHSAASAAAAWRAQGWHRASVAINVSPPQFFESDFVEHVARTLERTGLPASALELEITETVFQTGPATIESLRRLRALGVAVALDDFGIGYSSLTSLEQLPITRVKLDRLLVAGVDTNPRSAAIVRSIVALCHGLGLQVVAEGRGAHRAAGVPQPLRANQRAGVPAGASGRGGLGGQRGAGGQRPGAAVAGSGRPALTARRRRVAGVRRRHAPPSLAPRRATRAQEGRPRRHPDVGLVGEEAVDAGCKE